jgi:hypothetical protein
MRKQKLSPEASKAKAVRDKKIAMTPHRKKRKRDNERMGQRSDSDIHHPSGGGPAVRVSIKNNRGNFGKGTKIEGPNMMGQTWLNRRIKGPSAVGREGGEGDPPKKKGGVKPYVTYDRDDPRIQAYSDSLSVHNQYKNQIQPDFEITSTSWNSKDAKEEYQKLKAKVNANNDYIYKPLEESTRVQDVVRAKYPREQWEKLRGSEGVPGGPYQQLARQMDEEVEKAGKPFWDIVDQRKAEVGKNNDEMGARMRYLKSQNVTTKNNQLNFEFNKPDPNFTVKGMKPEKWEKKTKEGTSYYTGSYEIIKNKYGYVFGEKISNDPGSYSKSPDYIQYSPKFKKPKQEVILKGLEKMPIGKLKSNYNTPELSYRKPETFDFVYYDKPKKTSLAVTGHPGSEKQYATVNRQDKKGTVVLNKDEYIQENKKIFLKIK